MEEQQISWLFSEEAQLFLKANADKKPESFLLSKALLNKGWDPKIIARQLKGLKVAEYKFPTWFQTPNILYPTGISLEQASSEITAKYKASIFKGESIVDLSGGMGIDSYFLSRGCHDFTYVEPSKELNEISSYNFQKLGAKNIKSICTKAEDFLKENKEQFSGLYIDPSRRKGEQRIAAVSQWEPDVIGLKAAMWNISDSILVKLSPMVDISEVCKELGEVKEVHVVSYRNECKEVLLLLHKSWKHPYQIFAVALHEEQDKTYAFYSKQEEVAAPHFSEPLQYIYEPDAALLKAGAFKKIAVDFNFNKIHAHTHLYTSNELSSSFMGRCFQVEEVLPCSKKNISALIAKGKDYHVMTRNAVLTADQVKKQWKLVERGNDYLILYKGLDGLQYIAKTKRIF